MLFIFSILVISVWFEGSDFSILESSVTKEIFLNIIHPISVDTHFFVLAMTYEEYDQEYAALNMTYPGLDEFTLNDEYDQAECKLVKAYIQSPTTSNKLFNFLYAVEDFVTRRIPFTIPGNQTVTNRTIEIVVVDDNMFEPVEEGFRLLLIVDEERTPRSLVRFVEGRQLALFRINDLTDSELCIAHISTTVIVPVHYFSKLSFQPLHLDLRINRST